MELEFNLGVAEDPRSPEKKERDIPHSKIAGAPVIVWKEKSPEEWTRYVEREQDGSLSCMAQAGAKAKEVIKKNFKNINEIYSAHPPYRSRKNYPYGGMWTQDLGDVYKNVGTNLESVDPSQRQTESQMNRDITVTTPFKIGGYGFPNFKDIDEIAEAIEIRKHCILTFHANKKEWTMIPKYNGGEINFGHGICAVDYFLYKGVKTILLEDSTGHFNSFDKKGARLITEEYLKIRCTSAIYFTLEPPQFLFTITMRLGNSGNEVRELQKRMNYEKVSITPLVLDGKFGKKTKDAVINYQIAKQLAPDGVVGKNTRAELNKPLNA